MLKSPVVKDHSAKGLAQGMLSCSKDFGVENNQVEGIGIMYLISTFSKAIQ